MRQSTLSEVWAYTVYVVASARADAPLAIHSRSGEREDWGDASDEIIRGLPFSRSFLKRVDRELPRPIRNALQACKPLRTDHQTVKEARRAQWRVVAAVVKDGETDTEACRKRLGMSEPAFNAAALGGLLAFRSALERVDRVEAVAAPVKSVQSITGRSRRVITRNVYQERDAQGTT